MFEVRKLGGMMKSYFYLEKIIIKNRAPFDSLELNFKENDISVLTAGNGKGKTTILSYVVDAWHEILRPHFHQTFKNIENEYYRVSSSIFNINNKSSCVYIRFKALTIDKEENRDKPGYIIKNTKCYKVENIDYLDIRGEFKEADYNTAINIKDKIQYSKFSNHLSEHKYVKQISNNSKKMVDNISLNISTYFPAYRYELPNYINNVYTKDIEFSKDSKFTGVLNNPIEVVSGLKCLSNWLMDLLLDMKVNEKIVGGALIPASEFMTMVNVNKIINKMLCYKTCGKFKVRLGIGRRNTGLERIAIMNDQDHSIFYPTIFNLSAGEASILCLFGEILRQADRIYPNIQLQSIGGIVLIDEIDKHLHIKLQTEVIPELFKLFPNIQFIITSHSPFINIGLTENSDTKNRTKIIDLDKGGIITDVITNELYQEVYKKMIDENDRFYDQILEFKSKVSSSTKPLIVTEGKTDIKHLQNAYNKLSINDCDVEFYEMKGTFGDKKLKPLLENISMIPQNRKIIGLFDRDDSKIIQEMESGMNKYKDYGNNVYAFCLPIPVGNKYGDKISIEHYYNRTNLLKQNVEQRRLFLGEEFHYSAKSIDGKYQVFVSEERMKNIVADNKIIDNNVYALTDLKNENNVAMSKDNFADLVSDNVFNSDFDFSNFKLIFDKIKEIIK